MTRATAVTHAASGVTFEPPEGWEQVLDDPGMLIVAAPEGPGGFLSDVRANLVLVVEPLADLDFSTWQNGVDEEMPVRLADYFLVDLEHLTVAGHDGGRRLAHHVDTQGRALVMEQWFTQVGSTGITLTSTVGVPDHDATTDLFADVAATLTAPA